MTTHDERDLLGMAREDWTGHEPSDSSAVVEIDGVIYVLLVNVRGVLAVYAADEDGVGVVKVDPEDLPSELVDE